MNKNMKREPGYYWIKYMGWQIAYYDGLYWRLIAVETFFIDDDLDKINEKRILMPDEKEVIKCWNNIYLENIE